jgi:hypothetical protein
MIPYSCEGVIAFWRNIFLCGFRFVYVPKFLIRVKAKNNFAIYFLQNEPLIVTFGRVKFKYYRSRNPKCQHKAEK